MQLLFMCVCILGHAEPWNLFDPGVGRGCNLLYLVKVTFWDSNYIYSDILFKLFLFKNSKIENQKEKKNNHNFPIFLVSRKRANKHLVLRLIAKYYNHLNKISQT